MWMNANQVEQKMEQFRKVNVAGILLFLPIMSYGLFEANDAVYVFKDTDLLLQIIYGLILLPMACLGAVILLCTHNIKKLRHKLESAEIHEGKQDAPKAQKSIDKALRVLEEEQARLLQVIEHGHLLEKDAIAFKKEQAELDMAINVIKDALK